MGPEARFVERPAQERVTLGAGILRDRDARWDGVSGCRHGDLVVMAVRH
jgi:hypothetical protein